MDMTDFAALTTFVAVAEERSFTKAAKRQGVTPSAISHAMRALEEELGVRLIARTTRSVALTEAGHQLLGRLRPALNEVSESLQAVSGPGDGRRDVFACLSRGLQPQSLHPKSVSCFANIQRSCWISPRMTLAETSWRTGLMRASISASTSRRT